MGMIVKGKHPWNLHPQDKGREKECPQCFNRIIRDDVCIECEYSPALECKGSKWR
tara:strand:- start:68 stop:232 length:165 start_codon:yes stop_codon:yes gene_type:complete